MKQNEKAGLTAGGCCWFIFAILLLAQVHGRSWITALDQFGYHLTQPTAAGKTALMTGLTEIGDPSNLQIVVLIIMVLLWWQKRVADSLWYGSLNFIGYLLVIFFKQLIQRPRPSQRLITVGGYSFPSGHTFAVTIFLFSSCALIWPLIKRRWQRWLIRFLVLFLILLVMYTRVYLRAHYPSDVVAGLMLASGWWLIAEAYRRPVQRFIGGFFE